MNHDIAAVGERRLAKEILDVIELWEENYAPELPEILIERIRTIVKISMKTTAFSPDGWTVEQYHKYLSLCDRFNVDPNISDLHKEPFKGGFQYIGRFGDMTICILPDGSSHS